jgi:arylsulfatase
LKLIDEMGGPMTYPHYPQGWSMAGNTPFKRYKQNTHAGGNTDPLIIHWPKGIRDPGGLRRQYHHLIDVTPTVLDIVGLAQPMTVGGVDQRPFDGVSMRYSFDEPQAPGRRHTQYYEMLGHRAIYHDGWKAVAYHERGTDFELDRWELYHVDEDFSESRDLAKENPALLKALVERWWSEAGKYNVLPLDDRGTIRALDQPRVNRPRTTATYFPEMPSVPRASTLDVRNRSYSIRADVEIPPEGAEGVLLSMGGRFSGFSLFVLQNRLHYAYNFFGLQRYTVASSGTVPAGAVSLRVDFNRTGNNQGTAVLFIGDREAGQVDVARTVPLTFGLAEGLTIGRDPSTPVTEGYASPFAFTGRIKKVVMTLKEAPPSVGAP